jgi:hypothetical protein
VRAGLPLFATLSLAAAAAGVAGCTGILGIQPDLVFLEAGAPEAGSPDSDVLVYEDFEDAGPNCEPWSTEGQATLYEGGAGGSAHSCHVCATGGSFGIHDPQSWSLPADAGITVTAYFKLSPDDPVEDKLGHTGVFWPEPDGGFHFLPSSGTVVAAGSWTPVQFAGNLPGAETVEPTTYVEIQGDSGPGVTHCFLVDDIVFTAGGP